VSIFDPAPQNWPQVALGDWLKTASVEKFALGTEENSSPPVLLRKETKPWKLVGEDELDSFVIEVKTEHTTSSTEEVYHLISALIDVSKARAPARIIVSSGMKFVETVSKLRALRQLAETLGYTDTVVRACIRTEGEPATALVRATVHALCAILGTADEIEVDAEPFAGIIGDEPQRRALAVGQILREEAGLRAVADPAAGSFSVEKRTREIIDDVWNRLHLSREFKSTSKSDFKTPNGGLPGFPPFVRGPYSSMYLKSPWTIRQYAGFSTAEETNAFYRNALASGQRGLSVAFDLPTHRGYDSDHHRVTGDVGKAGVAIDTVEDMKRLFAGIPLGKMTVSMTMNGAVLPIMAFFIVAAEEQGVAASALGGTIQNDILKEYMVRNTYIYPPAPSLRIAADIMAWLSKNSPKFNSVSISGYHMHEAGATAAQELAYTLANGLEYLKAGREAGVDADLLASRLSFFWAQGMDHLTEIAKLRAARGLWSRLLHDAGITRPKSLALRCHCQTSGWSLTRQEAPNNIIRTTIEALSAVHGHTQSLHTNSLDEAIALPSDAAAKISLQTQLILQKETDICEVIDPWGGSLEVESRTTALAEEAWREISEITAAGGMVAAISKGIPQSRIESASAARQARIDSGAEKIVGVNFLRSSQPERIETREIDNRAVREAQIERLASAKALRDATRVHMSLSALENAARDGVTNLLEAAIEAARARATIGEISDALERVFGRHSAVVKITTGVYGGAMTDESELSIVRDRTAHFQQAHGRRPRILVAKMGQDGHDRGAKIVACAFADFGFDVDLAPLFGTPEEICRQALDNDVHLIGISTLAGGHKTLVPDLIRCLHEAGAAHVRVSVGGIIPDGDYAFLKEAGVVAIFGPGSRLPDCAHALLNCIEVP